MRAFITLAASFGLVTAGLQEGSPARYNVGQGRQPHQQVILENAISPQREPIPPSTSATVLDAVLPGQRTDCMHNGEATTISIKSTPVSIRPPPVVVSTKSKSAGPDALVLPSNSTTRISTSQALADTDAETDPNDEGAAGPVAKASLFPLVIGLAAAVVML